MLQQLPETRAARERRWGWMVPSVAVHVAIITAAAFAPAGGVEVQRVASPTDTIIFRVPEPRDGASGRRGATNTTTTTSTSQLPSLPQPDLDATTIPEPGTPTIWTLRGDSVAIGELAGDRGAAALGSAPGGVIGEATADEPVRVRAESMPHYPAQLRAMGVAGTVELEFVVDTTGRADLATARVVASPDDRFTSAVRAALRDARFVPGRFQGRAVRTLVRRAYRFELERGTPVARRSAPGA